MSECQTTTAENAPPALTQSTGWLLSAARQAMASATATALPAPLTLRTFAVLVAAAEHERERQVVLARYIGLDKTTMVAAVDELERAGLVERTSCVSDRRVKLIAITETGLTLLEEAKASLAEAEIQALQALSQEEQLVLKQLLEKLKDSLEYSPGSCL